MSELKPCEYCNKTDTCAFCGLTQKIVPMNDHTAPDLPEGYHETPDQLWIGSICLAAFNSEKRLISRDISDHLEDVAIWLQRRARL
tara:strand:+ start:166 stop:423 length:258 start_codon:yes stop_codon:yes gene_type:complete